MNDPHQGGAELKGRIKWFNPEKGFGFVTPANGASDIFLHISALKEAGLQDAPEGSTIVCEVGPGRKGVQVMRVISLDTSTAAPSRAPRRSFGGPRGDFGDRAERGERGGYRGERGGDFNRGPRHHYDD